MRSRFLCFLIVFVSQLSLPQLAMLPVEKCGCVLHSNRKADCSNRKCIDYECLSYEELEHILLSYNNFTVFPEGILLNYFSTVRVLDLSHNSITKLPEGLSKPFLPKVRIIMDYNSLADPMDLLLIDPSYMSISARYNKFECDCGVKSKVIRQGNALKMTVMCTGNKNGKKIYDSIEKFCREEQLSKEESEQPSDFSSTKYFLTPVIFIVLVLIGCCCIVPLNRFYSAKKPINYSHESCETL